MKQSLIDEINRGEFYRAYNGAKIPNSVLEKHDKNFEGKNSEHDKDSRHKEFKIICEVYKNG